MSTFMKHTFPALLFAVIFSGCSVVYTPKPIGEKPKNLTQEIAEWEGDWSNPEGDTFKIKVADPEKGILQVAGIETKDKGFELKKLTVYLRESGGWSFASVKNDEIEGGGDARAKDLYVWARISRDGRQLIYWQPSGEKFTELVKNGLLPGKIEDKSVLLGELETKHMEAITSGSNGVLFDWETPTVLRKISK